VLSRGGDIDGEHVCHTWINDGKVQFLGDCTHEFAGQTLDLLDVDYMQLSQPQYDFLSSSADWCLYGGAAGSGKTHAISLDPLRHCQGPTANTQFRGAMFRRTYPQLTSPGGLLDHCKTLYSTFRGKFNHTRSDFTFPSASKIALSTLQYEKDLDNYQGAQLDWVAFDEATQFPLKFVQFMWGRCRSKSGIKPTLRMTCNPDNDSWLFNFVHWWIDPSTGLPLPSRSGITRHFIAKDSSGGQFDWYDEPQYAPNPTTGAQDCITTSATFIPATLADNRALLDSDPTYRQRLEAMSDNDRQRFLYGCWLASSKESSEWPRDLFTDIWITPEQFPQPRHREVVRMFAIDPSKGRLTKEGDYSAIVCLAQTADLGYVDADLARRPPGQIIEDLFAFCEQPHHRIRSGDMLGIETLQFQSLFKNMLLLHAQANPSLALSQFLLSGNPVIEVEDSLNKMMRIRRLDEPIRKRRLRYLNTPGTVLLVNQLKQFDGTPGKGKYDDGPDALDMCRQLPIQYEYMMDPELRKRRKREQQGY
jgi:hypothetical protein